MTEQVTPTNYNKQMKMADGDGFVLNPLSNPFEEVNIHDSIKVLAHSSFLGCWLH